MFDVEQEVIKLKRSIKRHINEEFKFQPKLWKKYKKNRNCFTYAFNMREGKLKDDLIVNYEMIVGRKPMQMNEASVDEWYNITVQVLKKLGLNFKRCKFETKVPKGYFKVAWYISDEDIHWLRRDDDGTWSHKQGWYRNPTNIDLDGNLILNPEEANIELEEGDQLLEVRYFLISRNYQG